VSSLLSLVEENKDDVNMLQNIRAALGDILRTGGVKAKDTVEK